jgi:hypothetical protein
VYHAFEEQNDAEGVHPQPNAKRAHFTLALEPVGDSWHVTVRELPRTWTVAFSTEEIEDRARNRISLDTGLDTRDFDVTFDPYPRPFIERRAGHRREGGYWPS